MSRSVWTHADALETVFYQLDDDGDEFSCDLWDCHIEDIREAFKRKFPSMNDCDFWPEKESHAILENTFAKVVISEYAGLVSLAIVPNEFSSGWHDDVLALAHSWCVRNATPFLREHYGELEKIGTMSNGEAVYQQTGETT